MVVGAVDLLHCVSATVKLDVSDYMHMFREIDRKGMGECIVTPAAIFQLFDTMHEPLDEKYEKKILKEIEKANDFSSSWDGDLTLEGFIQWLKSGEKVAQKLVFAAVTLKEQELQRSLFDQLDDDSSGEITAEELAILGKVARIELTTEETDQAFLEMDVDGGGAKQADVVHLNPGATHAVSCILLTQPLWHDRDRICVF